jgi:Sigma-70 region 2
MESSRPLAPTGEHLSRYFRGVRSFPMLSAEAERALCYRWRDHHDISAAHQLVGSHLRLVARIAKVYRGYGLPLEELIGEGHVGMMRALCRFDPDRGVRFATYALWWVRASIQEYILHNWSNRVLRGSVPVDAFRHVALWNDDEARIEMHLEATPMSISRSRMAGGHHGERPVQHSGGNRRARVYSPSHVTSPGHSANVRWPGAAGP